MYYIVTYEIREHTYRVLTTSEFTSRLNWSEDRTLAFRFVTHTEARKQVEYLRAKCSDFEARKFFHVRQVSA